MPMDWLTNRIRVDRSSQAMGPSRPDKSRTAAGLRLATSVLLSPQNPQHHTPAMGFGKFFGLSSSSSSGPSSSRSQGNYRPPLGPGSSKTEYAYDLNQSGPSTSQGYSQGYYRNDQDAPPPYHPQVDPDPNDWASDSKTSVPRKSHRDWIRNLTGSGGEDPLQALFYYDVFIILDDSSSMLAVDNRGGRDRWTQVSDGSLPLVVWSN